MSDWRPVAARRLCEYPKGVRALVRFLVLLAVALLPLTSFAARAGTATDLTSNAVEIEQSSLPTPGHRIPPAQQHHHCTLWAAEVAGCLATSDSLSMHLLSGLFGSHVGRLMALGPQAPTPPPKV